MATWSSACHSDPATAPTLSASTVVFNEADGGPGFTALYSIGSDGRNRRRLTTSGIQPITFAIAPDGRHLAISVDDASAPIWILDANGNVIRKVSSPSDESASAFGNFFDVESWSLNGTLLVCGYPDIAEMRTSGAFKAVATDDISYDGQFSPDGSLIVFARTGPDGTEIATMNVDGSNIRFLTSLHGGAEKPAWSPDGRRIAFSKLTPDTVIAGVRRSAQAVYVMNADGSGLMQLSPASVYDSSPTWSPDGKQLAIMRSTDEGVNFDIYIMNADGSGAHAITSDGGLKWTVRWSPI